MLLAHQPAEWASARRLGAGLMLSGHNHRGQVWPQHYLVMLAQPLFYGHYGPRDGQPRGGEARTQAIVSAGARYWGVPLRSLAGANEVVMVRLWSPSANRPYSRRITPLP